MVKAKTFIAALNNFHQSQKKNKRVFNDKRLTQLEKNIFQCKIWLSDSKFDLIIETLEDASPSGDPIIDSQKEIILGTALNNKCDAANAIKHLKKAIHLLETHHGPARQIFSAYYNLYNCYYNLKNVKGMEQTLSCIKLNAETTINEELIYYSCQFTFYSFTGNHHKAQELLQKLQSHKKHMTDYQKTIYFLDKFDYYFKIDHFSECYKTLEEMRKNKKFHIGANYKFMKGLLDHLTLNSPLYLYEKDFKEFPILLNQVQTLKCLEENNRDRAKNFWNFLQNTSPAVYQPDFKFQGDKCLFSECLKKYQNQKEVLFIPQQSNKLDLLLFLLNSSSSMSKEDIFEKVYGVPFSGKDDLKKLAQLIYKLKETRDVEIKSRKGCYILQPHKKAA